MNDVWVLTTHKEADVSNRQHTPYSHTALNPVCVLNCCAYLPKRYYDGKRPGHVFQVPRILLSDKILHAKSLDPAKRYRPKAIPPPAPLKNLPICMGPFNRQLTGLERHGICSIVYGRIRHTVAMLEGPQLCCDSSFCEVNCASAYEGETNCSLQRCEPDETGRCFGTCECISLETVIGPSRTNLHDTTHCEGHHTDL